MRIKKHSYIILKYLSQYDNKALVRNEEVYTQINISEHNFSKASEICFAFGFTEGSRTHIGITEKGRVYLKEFEENL